MAAFGIVAICPVATAQDYHTFGYVSSRAAMGASVVLVSFVDGIASAESSERFSVRAAGDVVVGPRETGTDLATTATAGFLYIRTCNGAPTGVPALAGTGRVPLVFDRANNKLYAYDGGWIGATLS